MRVLRSLILSTVVATTAAPALAWSLSDWFGSSSSDKPKRTPIVLPMPEKQSFSFPSNRTFVAETFKGQPFKGDRPTLLLSTTNRATGFSSCNNWSATALVGRNQRIAVGPIAVTKRKCEARLMHNEQIFLYVFRSAQAWSFDGRVLTILSPAGPMTFVPAI